MDSPTPFALASSAADELRRRLGVDGVDLALVLGSGLGGADQILDRPRRLAQAELPGFVAPTVGGHAGEVVVGRIEGHGILILAGRVHLYEGRSAHEVCHGVRVAAAAGARTVVLTNAAGAIDPTFEVGSLVRIGDHLDLSGANPLAGPHDGPQPSFVDLTEAYDAELRTLAGDIRPDMPESVYASLRGPSFETPAEIRMLATLGAGLVGMSTACETIACRHLGVRVAGFSLVTNRAAGLGSPLSHDEVASVGRAAATDVTGFLAAFIPAAVRSGRG